MLSYDPPRSVAAVRRDNTHATAFCRRLGMTETHWTEQDIFITFPRGRFMADRDGYLVLLRQAGRA